MCRGVWELQRTTGSAYIPLTGAAEWGFWDSVYVGPWFMLDRGWVLLMLDRGWVLLMLDRG
jgi:hypothetical protein